MLDLKFIREQPDVVRAGVARKGEDPARVDDVIAIDTRRRELLQRTEALKSRKNTVSADVAKLKAARENADALIAEMRAVADEIKGLDDQLRTVEEQLRAALLLIPNIPHPDVPDGRTPADNTVIAEWGSDPVIDFTPKPHWELLETLHLVDFARGTKITGAGFPVYRVAGRSLERALINFFLDEASASGYTEMFPPLLVNEESATGTGQLPDKEDQMYVVHARRSLSRPDRRSAGDELPPRRNPARRSSCR